MKKLKLWLTAGRLERKWRHIGRNRRKMGKLLAEGEAYTSRRLVELDEQNAELGSSYIELIRKYREMEQADQHIKETG